MHKRHYSLFPLLITCLLAVQVHAANETPAETALTPKDFAYALPLQVQGQSSLYQTTLPISVYQNTARSDLGDLRVFNAQGEVVPYMLLTPTSEAAVQTTQSPLPFFPLKGKSSTDMDSLHLHFQRNAAGTLIDLDTHPGKTTSTPLYGYLIDASALKQSVHALDLELGAGSDDFATAIDLESSDDLKHWQSVLQNSPLIDLRYNGHRLQQTHLEFPALHSNYLRLRWDTGSAAPMLHGVQATSAAQHNDAPLSWTPAIQGQKLDGKAIEYQFDAGAHLPLQRIRLTLPQTNTVVQATLLSKARPEDTWQTSGNVMLYRLQHDGLPLTNPDVPLRSTHRYWLLRIDEKGGGLGAGVPEMQIGWQPHQLQFIARGEPPFLLAYGNRDIRAAEFNLQNVLAMPGQGSTALAPQPAIPGAQIISGGEAHLLPPPTPLPWKKWILWFILAAAVLLLGWMALRLIKQLEQKPTNK